MEQSRQDKRDAFAVAMEVTSLANSVDEKEARTIHDMVGSMLNSRYVATGKPLKHEVVYRALELCMYSLAEQLHVDNGNKEIMAVLHSGERKPWPSTH